MKKLVYIISFFSFSGYYAGLAIMYSLGLGALSRQYSIPIRIISAVIMLKILVDYRHRLLPAFKSSVVPLFLIFWAYYFLKVFYTEIIAYQDNLARPWEEYIFYPLLFVILPFLTFFAIPFHKYRKEILNALILSGLILGAVCTYLYGPYLLAGGFGRLNFLTYQTGDSVLSPLAASYAGSLTFVLCIYKLYFEKNIGKGERIYLLITMVFSTVLFLMGSSRGSVIALVLSLPLILFYSKSRSQKAKFLFLGLLLAPIFFWTVTASGSNIFDRILNTSQDGGGRIGLWKNALNHFFDYPVFGGLIEIGGIYPHNFFVELLMSTGIVGGLILIPIIIKGFIIAFSKVKESQFNLFWLILLIQGITQYMFSGSFATATLFFIPLGIAYGLYYQDASD